MLRKAHYYDGMKLQNTHTNMQKLNVFLTDSEKEQAKRIAKSKGMTFAGWLGVAVKDAMAKEKTGSQPRIGG